MSKPLILQTDFGLADGAVSAMYGVAFSVDENLKIFDLTHDIQPYDVWEASYRLIQTVSYWKAGSVFVSVVDPGVGSSRRSVAVKIKGGQYVITPDNGTLTHLKMIVGIEEAREIDETKNRYQGTESVSVFHGRDLFAYTAAKLASGQITFEEVGESYPVDDIVLLDYEYLKADVKNEDVHGIVSNVSDPFGSIVFNVLTEDFNRVGYHEGDMIHIVLENEQGVYFDENVLYAQSFGFVDIGQPVIFNSSSDYISIGLNQGSFKDVYQVKAGLSWKVQFHKAD